MKIKMQCLFALFAVLGGAMITNFAQAQNANLYVAHAAPGRNVSSTEHPELPVDLQINNVCVAQGIAFGDIRGPFSEPAGSYTVQFSTADVAKPCKGTSAFTATIGVAAGTTYFGVLTLDASNKLTGQIYTPDLTPVKVGEGRLQVINAGLDPLNTFLTSSAGNSGVVPVPPGTIAEGGAPAAIYTGTVTDASNAVQVGPVIVQIEPTNSYIYVLGGSTANHTVQIIGPAVIRGVF